MMPFVDMPTIFTAQSKLNFYCRDAICEFVLKAGAVPLNPFRVFEYFLGDRVERDAVRRANNKLVHLVDELWVFGDISDGMFAELEYAYSLHKPVRYFTAGARAEEISEIKLLDVAFEDELLKAKQATASQMRSLLHGLLRPTDVVSPASSITQRRALGCV